MAVTEQERRRGKRRTEILILAVLFLLGCFFMLHMGMVLKYYPNFVLIRDVNSLLNDTALHISTQPTSIMGGNRILLNYFVLIYFAGICWYISSQKKLMPGKEHGTARWGTQSEAKRVMNKNFAQNILLTETERLSLNARKIRKNLNVMVIGDSGAGKTRFFIKPNLMQLHTSYVITDPKGEILRDTGKMLADNGYEIKVFNLVDMEHSCCYSPFAYIEKEEDVMKVINCLIKNTTPPNSSQNDPFWEKSETALLQALFYFIWYRLPIEEQNFHSVLRLLRMAIVKEEDDDYKSDLDYLFDIVREEEPQNIAVLQYDIFKKAAGKTAKSIIISAGVRLAVFNIPAVADLTHKDTLELRELSERKMALFVMIPDSDTTFNFIVAMLYSQMFLLFSNLAFQSPNGALKNHVRFLLDEFANIGVIPDFDAQAATMRSKNFSVTVVLQHLAQLEKMYKESWKAIMNCCNTKLYLGGDEKETTEYFSAMLGKETIDVQTGNLTRGRNRSSTQNYNKQARELMLPDEIAHMPDSDCILMIKGMHPFYSKKYNIKKHKNYKCLYDPEEHPENFFDYKQIITPKMPRPIPEKITIEKTDKPKLEEVTQEEQLDEVALEEVNLVDLSIGIEEMRYALEYEPEILEEEEEK